MKIKNAMINNQTESGKTDWKKTHMQKKTDLKQQQKHHLFALPLGAAETKDVRRSIVLARTGVRRSGPG